MKLPKLDGRLRAAAAMFDICETAADIGADHGKLGLHLLAGGFCRRLIMTDISDLSLEKARKTVKRFGLEARTGFLVGDGLKVLSEPVDFVSVLGMGGHVIGRILSEGKAHLCGAKLILSPHTHPEQVRRVVYRSIGYHLTQEKIIRENGRYYILMRAEPGEKAVSEREMYLGPCLTVQNGDGGIYRDYVHWRCDVLSVSKEAPDSQKTWLMEECERVDGRRG